MQLEVGGTEVDMVVDHVDSGGVTDCNSVSPCESAPCTHGGTCRNTTNLRGSLELWTVW